MKFLVFFFGGMIVGTIFGGYLGAAVADQEWGMLSFLVRENYVENYARRGGLLGCIIGLVIAFVSYEKQNKLK